MHSPSTIFLVTIISDVGVGAGHIISRACGIDGICTNAIVNGTFTNDVESYMAPRANSLDPVLLAKDT